MEKRGREDPQLEGFQFVYPNGSLVPGEVLLARYRDVVLRTLAQAPFETVKAFEQATRLAKPLIQQYRVWEQLFVRDFPDTYAIAVDEKMNMRDDVKKKLDQLSVRPNNPLTYWKRYYELKKMNVTQLIHVYQPQSTIVTFGSETLDELHRHPIYNLDRVGVSFKIASTKAPNEVIGYYIPDYISIQNAHNPLSDLGRLIFNLGMTKAVDKIRSTSRVIQITYNTQTRAIEHTVVPYDATLFRAPIFLLQTYTWQSLSGFECFSCHVGETRTIVISACVINAIDDHLLVSTCVGCNIEPVTVNCGGLCNDPLYCSQSCAQTHYAIHKQDCNKSY